MALKTILLLFLCFLISSTAEQNYSEHQCSLVPVGEDLSSEFQLKASEKGVKLVYLHVNITGNDSYSPLNVQDEFLPDWWVYARSISEPMLSLPYDYDVLSLGLLNYQVRSMRVPLKENPVGCLVALNSSCLNEVIGSSLLKDVTRTIHKEDVVCVQYIKDYNWFRLLYYEDNLEYDCCITEKISGEIRCNQSAKTTVWLEAFIVVLLILQGVLVLCFPGFPLALPDYVINFQEELEKEKQEEKVLENELDRNNQGQEQTEDQRDSSTDSCTEGYQNLFETEILVHYYDGRSHSRTSSSPVRSEDEPHHCDDQGQVQGRVCGHNRRDSSTGGDQHPSEQKSVYMDDTSPVTFCNLLKRIVTEYSGCLQYLKFSFNVKLAILVIGVAPIFIYVRIILALTIKRRVFDETAEKNDAFLDGLQLFSLNFFHLNSSLNITILVLLIVVPLVAIFFLRPRDFTLDKESWSFKELKRSRVCREHSSSVGEDMRRHIENWQLNFKWFVIRIIETHSYVITMAITAIKCTACVRHIKPSERLKRTFINAFCLLPSYIFIFLFFGVILGLVGFVILLVAFIVISVFYSPLACVLKIAYLKLFRAYNIMSGDKSSFECFRCKTSIQRSVLFPISAVVSTVFYFFVSIPFAFLILFLALWVTLPCFLAALSGRFLVKMFALTVMGSVFNRKIVTHFLAFLIAAVTNLSLCYYNFQNAYKEIKEMIFKYRQKHRPQNCSVDTGEDQSFPEDLFWYVIDDHRVLPIIPEFYWMLAKMVVILIFLFCALCSAIFNDHHDFGAVYFTIYLFATGAIAGLIFKGMTIGQKFTGERKQKMEKQIEDAVISFYGRRREAVVRIYTHV